MSESEREVKVSERERENERKNVKKKSIRSYISSTVLGDLLLKHIYHK